MIYDLSVDLLKHLTLSLDFLKPYATFLGVVILLLRQNNIKKIINSHLPKKYRDTQSNDIYDMKKDIRAIKQHLGVVECGDIKTSSNTEARSYRRLSLLLQMARNLKNRRRKRMREYLKKLTSRKFQALLVSLVVNIVSAVLFALGIVDIDGVVNQWMPIINMTIGTISTWVYIWVEGSIDKTDKTKEANPVDQLNIPIEPTE